MHENERELYELSGQVEEIIFRNESNGYTVMELNCDDTSVTAVGIAPLLSVGEELRLVGRFKNHPSYGEQFSIEALERTMPSTASAILKYLSSGAVKGIGPVIASKLVESFGDKTLDIIQNEPERITIIKGLSKSKALTMSEELKKAFGVRQVMSQLQKFGVPTQSAVRAWQIWGSKTMDVIAENPYVLCADEMGVPFEIADKIAFDQEKPFDDNFRVRASLVHILSHNRSNGHTCLPADKLLDAAVSYIKVDKDKALEALETMLTEGALIREDIDERSFIFLPYLHQCEIYASSRMHMLLRFPAPSLPGIEKDIALIEKESKIEYASLQKEAITKALTQGMLILTGGPGTGKTTTLNAIIKILKKNGQKVFLAAPTGRAAQRMSDVTGEEAKTIHRLLEVTWDKQDRPVFKRGEKNPLNCDALILDEMSMVDVQLFDSVMRALPLGCRFILVGDSDQLPSVGPGNVLGDLIASGRMPVVQLTEIFRQSMESLIVTNAHKIVNGDMPTLSSTDSDFFFMYRNNPVEIASTIVELCQKRLPATYGYTVMNDIQVLSPSRKGGLGCNELNKVLQDAINPNTPGHKQVTIGRNTFRQGDKVMQVKNDYLIPWTRSNGEVGEGIFNGDVGVLVDVSKNRQSLLVQFDDRLAQYDLETMTDLDLAYATTVHKSQGNEFNAVIMPMYPGPSQLYYRNLLYTAVTRAKKILIMVGTKDTVSAMVKNNRRTLRFSALKSFLMLNGDNT